MASRIPASVHAKVPAQLPPSQVPIVIAACRALSRRVSRFVRPRGVRNRHKLAYSSQTCVIGTLVVIVAILGALALRRMPPPEPPSPPAPPSPPLPPVPAVSPQPMTAERQDTHESKPMKYRIATSRLWRSAPLSAVLGNVHQASPDPDRRASGWFYTTVTAGFAFGAWGRSGCASSNFGAGLLHV